MNHSCFFLTQDKKKDNWMWAHRWLNLSGGQLEAGDTRWSGAAWRIQSEMTLMLWRFCPFPPFSPPVLERKWESAVANSNTAHCLGAGHAVHGKIPWRVSKKNRFFSCHELITVYGRFRRLDAITVTQIHSFSQHKWGLHSLIYSWDHSCCSAWMNKVLQSSPPQGSGIWIEVPSHGPFSHAGSFNRIPP